MATQIGLTSEGVGIRYDLGTVDGIYVAATSAITSTTATAIFGSGSGRFATIRGAVFGHSFGIDLGQSQTLDSGQNIQVGAGAFVGSNLADNSAAIRFRGGNSALSNAGEISGYDGVQWSANGAGQTAGPLAAAHFWTSTTNLAHDGNDRFIFRTTGKTLWFDANGTAAGGLVLLADLQASAVVTTADIVLV